MKFHFAWELQTNYRVTAQPTVTCSELKVGTEQGVKYVQS